MHLVSLLRGLTLSSVLCLLPFSLHAQCTTGNAVCVGTDCTSTGDVEFATGSSTLNASDSLYLFNSFKEDVWTAGYRNGTCTTNTASSFIRVGTASIKHTVWGPDTLDSNGHTETSKRAEISDLAINVHPIKDTSGNYYFYWYGWSYYIPNDATWSSATLQQYIGQWRFNNGGGCVTMLDCAGSAVGGSGHHLLLNNGRLVMSFFIRDPACTNRLQKVEFDLGPVVKGQWMDFVMQAKWTSASTGMAKMWIQKNGGGYTEALNYSGATWLPAYNLSPCQYNGAEPLAPNWQVGLYYSNDTPSVSTPRVLYSDEISMTRTLCSTGYGSEAWNMVVPVAGSLNGTGTPTTIEMENNSYTNSSGDISSNFSDATYASGGVAVKFAANAVNDSTQTGVTLATAGTYNVKLRAKKFTSRATADLYINNVRIGAWDQYSATANDWAEKDYGNIALNAGTNTFKWIITGKNAAATNYDFTLDKLTLTP
jgi:Polysaccharide lyase